MREKRLARPGEVFRHRGIAGWAGVAPLLLLASCGGGGGDVEAPAMQLRNGPAEFLRCEVPQRILILRQNEGAAGWRTNRYLRFAGQALTKVIPAPGLEAAKNPEGVFSHGPLHAQNCTPGTGALQTVAFRVRSEGFYASGAGDHLAFGLRANYPTFNAFANEQYQGIGIVMSPFFGGVTGERFGFPDGNHVQPADLPQVDLADDTTYLVEIQAGTTFAAYRVTAEASGQSTGWNNYVQPADRAPLQGTGLLFAFLCRDANGRCEAFDSAFRVDIFDIVAVWR